MKENNVKIHFSSTRIQQGKIHSVFSEVEEKLKFISDLVAEPAKASVQEAIRGKQ